MYEVHKLLARHAIPTESLYIKVNYVVNYKIKNKDFFAIYINLVIAMMLVQEI